jgi:chemotaxis protein MotD
MPDVASPPVAVPTEGVRSLRRPAMPNGKSDQAADADFGKQLADMATGDERPTRSTGAREGREPPVSGWRQWGARFVPLDGDQGGVPEVAAANAAAADGEESEADTSLPAPVVVDDGLAVAAASATALPAVPAGPLPPPAMSIGPALSVPLSAPVDAVDAARSQQAKWTGPERSMMPRAAPNIAVPLRPTAVRAAADAVGPAPSTPQSPADATGSVQGVSVMGRETHLAPSMLPAGARQAIGRVAAEENSLDARVSADEVGASTKEAKPSAPYSIVAAARGKDGGQGPAQGSPGRAPVAQAGLGARAPAVEAGSQPQVVPAEDAVVNAPPASRGAGPVGHEALPSAQSLSSPLQQIADRIAADIPPVSEHGRTDFVASLPTTPPVQPHQVLTEKLHPAELGVVTVRIALKNDVLELQIETDRRDTARLVHADRETLSSLLRSAGYSVETMTVRAVDPSSAPASVGSQHASPDGAPQSQAGGSQPDAGPSGGRAHAEQDRNLHGSRRDSNDEQDGARHRAGDGLYV